MKKAIILLLTLLAVTATAYGHPVMMSVVGRYQTSEEAGWGCQLVLDLIRVDYGFAYRLQTQDTLYQGRANVRTSDNEEIVWVTLTDIFPNDTSGLEMLCGITELTFQNYGNAMNNYIKIKGCDQKYVTLVKQPSPEVTEYVRDSLVIKLREITRWEYETRKEMDISAYLQTPYEKITDINQAKKMLRGKVKEIDVPIPTGKTVEHRKQVEITFDDRTKDSIEWTDWNETLFRAYYPQLDILVLRSEADGEFVVDFKDRDNSIEGKVGNPAYHSVSPGGKWRINGYYPGGAAEGLYWWLEKWAGDTSLANVWFLVQGMIPKDEYKKVVDLIDDNFNGAGNWFWTDNNSVIFTMFGGTAKEHINDYTVFYEMRMVEKE